MSAATKNYVEQLKKERDTARRDYEVMSKLREAAEQERDEWKQQAEAEAIVADSYRDERDAALEREQALAAHMECINYVLKDAKLSLEHARFFISSRQKMHVAGREGHDESIAALDMLLSKTPTTCLARRDLIKQAEALDNVYKYLPGDLIHQGLVDWLSEYGDQLRQQAAAL